jgi:hypothetical protein
MEFVDIDTLLDYAMPQLPGCTEFLALDKLRFSVIEFCRRTLASQEDVTELDIEADEPLLEIPAPSNNVLVYRVMWIKTPNRTINGYIKNALADRSIDWNNGATGDWPTAFVRVSSDTVQLIPVPSVQHVGSITAHIACIPTNVATKIDKSLYEEHLEAIVSGALSRLLPMRKEPWYDPDYATVCARDFASAISNARASVNKDQLMADVRVQPHHF